MKYHHEYSQYFLQDKNFVSELIGHSNIRKRDHVIDIGAGSGIISASLSKKTGRVTAIEYEKDAVMKLQQHMQRYQNVEVIQADFMNYTLPTTLYKIFANIPFHLSSPILTRLTESPNPPRSIYLIVQKQFARKLLVERDDTFKSMLGTKIGPLYAAKIKRPLRKTDFWPHPNVDTVLLELKLRETPLLPTQQLAAYRTFVERAYTDIEFFRARISDNTAKPSHTLLESWIRLANQHL